MKNNLKLKRESDMKRWYRVEVELQAFKTLYVEADNENDAYEKAWDVCENEDIPVHPDEVLDIKIDEFITPVEESVEEPIK